MLRDTYLKEGLDKINEGLDSLDKYLDEVDKTKDKEGIIIITKIYKVCETYHDLCETIKALYNKREHE